MNHPTPAIVSQAAVRALPRAALWLLILGYVLPGFIGRAPWKSADVAAYGYMMDWASSGSRHGWAWYTPELMGLGPEQPGLLPYALGAIAIHTLGAWLGPEVAVRLPFVALLLLALAGTWYAVYHLARSPQAQPVAFAFGGEAHPVDYARALADASLLALLACLGLAQLAHETTPELAQLAFMATALFGLSALHTRRTRAGLALWLGCAGLALSGAATMALALAAVALLLAWHEHLARLWVWAAGNTVLVVALTLGLGLAHGPWMWPGDSRGWDSVVQALVWFTWPAWPLVLWGLWRWRGHWTQRHLWVPLSVAGVAVLSAVFTPAIERSLLLALPALAALAALALPTLNRSLSALIDWFTLLFFSTCALAIWVIWIATMTGVPAKPAANVAKLAPLFVPQFSWLAFVPALLATVAWLWLVVWRTGRHRSALWKSLVLPAGGTTLCWVLLMTLWLPMLDHARSFGVVISQIREATQSSPCLLAHQLTRAEIAALTHQGGFQLAPASRTESCPWLLLDIEAQASLDAVVNPTQWAVQRRIGWRVNRGEDLLLMRRVSP